MDLIEFVVEAEMETGPLYSLFHAHDREGRQLLLKKARPGDSFKLAAQRLRREYEICQGLHISGIPRAMGIIDHGGSAVLVLESDHARPLDLLMNEHSLPLADALQVASGIAEALAALHHAGYIHRDIQPSNILLDSSGNITLHGLGTASLVPRAFQGVQAASMHGMSPAYLSPELSGRTNRLVDYRTDFYSLGIMLFEMLTGRVPFISDDPVEVIHAHVAKRPPSPQDINPAVPATVAAIVLKLLEKSAEIRYQGGKGLRHDLDRCLADLQTHGSVRPFDLAKFDPPSRFEIPQRFYGRDTELKELSSGLDDASQGTLRVIMVTGYPGIGKTSLVREIRRSVFTRRGWFVTGKYDALERGTPYSGVREALRDLWRRILADEPDQVASYRVKLEQALGQNLGVIVDVAPELEAIVGSVPPVVDLEPVESKNRFQLCFVQTLTVLATAEHPLVLFLDDLQWADPSSLELIEGALEKGLGNLLLLGAYRDSEVNERHPLMQSLKKIKEKGIPVETLTLGPLDLHDIRRLVADALRTEVERAVPLADLVFGKTAGNAFFARSFLTTINDEGLLSLDQDGSWKWDLEGIARLETTENVIDLAARKIVQIPQRIRHTISMAAALGHPLDLDNLAAVCQTSLKEVKTHLIEGCRERILLRHENGFQFEHDRLQECAYSLIPENARRETHLRIGRLLASRPHQGDTQIFAILDHLNRALDLLDSPAERLNTANLNLAAGRMARAAAAFPAAHRYFLNGIALLCADAWDSNYDLALALHTEAAETASLTADFRGSDALVTTVFSHARTLLDKIPAYETQIAIAHARLLEADALRITLEVVQLLGIRIPEHPSPGEARQALLSTKDTLEAALSRPADQTEDGPHAESLAAMRLLTRAAASAGLVNHPLYIMISATLIGLAIRFPHSPEAPVSYLMGGGMLCYLLDDPETGCRAGDRGMDMLRRTTSPRWQSFCNLLFAIDIDSWRVPYGNLVENFAEAHRMGLQTGDFMNASMNAYCICETSLLCGTELPRLETMIREYLDECRRIGVERLVSGLVMLGKIINTLKQGDWAWMLRPGDALQESDVLAWHDIPDETVREISAYHEMMCLVIYRQNAAALKTAMSAHALPRGGITNILSSDFYICLSVLDALNDPSVQERKQLLRIVAAREEKIRIHARVCPINHQHRLDLVEAQRLRASGNVLGAMESYDRAIKGARRSRFLHEEALANELAAEFYLELGRTSIGSMYLKSAASAYGRWGAWGKLQHLHERYPDHFEGSERHGPSSPPLIPELGGTEPPAEMLRILSMERAAAALSAELDLPRLLEKLTAILLQSAGAQRGFLLREEAGIIFIESSGSVEDEAIEVLQGVPIESSDRLSRRIVRYVSRSLQTVVVRDAPQDERFAGSTYVVREKPRSILCTPLFHRGKPVGFLYLENNLIADAFDEDRLATIQVILSQAAVALENARLHDGLKKEIAIRRNAENELRRALDEVARLKDKLQAENVYLREEILGSHGFEEIIGTSDELKKVLHKVTRVATTDATVLVLGETGTGKELIARAIHSRSPRKDGPLVRVNCATLPATLIESELFGHEKGAFTGALTRKMGRFELADGGTIFLDEIGEIPLELQAKLLRVLQEGEFERVGSSTTHEVNVRVIAATNRDLKKEAESGTFRSDLYYRLSVFPIELPPLRDRTRDIPLLVWYFITKKQAELGKSITKISKEVMDALINYSWPGNIRELENVVERAIILSRGAALSLDDSFAGGGNEQRPDSSPKNLDEIERNHIMHVLDQCGWKVKGKGNAAELLGLNPSTLSFRMKKLGITRSGK